MNILSIYSFFSTTFFPGEFKLLGDIISIWFFWIIPLCWPIIILVNTAFYSIVMYIFMLCLKIDNPLKKLRKIIIRVTFFGFLCDLIVAGFLLLIILQVDNIINYKSVFYHWLKALWENPFNNVYALLTILVTILLSRVLNYKLNKRFTFSKLDIEEEKKKKLALAIAIFTAPYIFFFSINV